jgi:hypothetical protein
MPTRTAVLVVFLTVLSAATADAAQRTFVSAGSGSDANPCTRALPCRSFGAATGQTDAGGEVVVLDSGGYGPVTITKSVALIAPPGVHAAVSAFSGNAIDIAAGSNDVVVVRGLYLNGLGGTHGIDFTSGKALYVENCVISGFGAGMGVFGRAEDSDVYILDTVSRRNGWGFHFESSTLTRASLDSVRAEGNFAGVFAAGGSLVTVTRSVAAGNAYGFAADISGVLNIESSTTTMSFISGVYAGSGATARVRNSMITGNTSGIDGADSRISFGNNGLHGNGTDGSFSATIAQQ